MAMAAGDHNWPQALGTSNSPRRGGAPRIHGELRMLGFELSERTISRWMKRAPRDPDRARRWLAFLRNHQEAIGAMDFFTVPTITFGVLYWHAALPIMPTRYGVSGWEDLE